MRIILNARDTELAFDRIEAQVRTLRLEHRELRARYLTDRDGYPPSSELDGGGGATSELDDDGTPIAQHPDPVGRLVVSRDEANDPLGTLIASLVQHVSAAAKELEAGIGDAARSRPPIKVPDPDKIWCENCLKANVKEPREEDRKVCSWCRHEKSEHGEYPSPRLVEAHVRGRITPGMRSNITALDTADKERVKQQRRDDRRRRRGAAA